MGYGPRKPFLWHYIENVKRTNSVSKGEERPTASPNEEHGSELFLFINEKYVTAKRRNF
jgi:hypothetical protein